MRRACERQCACRRTGWPGWPIPIIYFTLPQVYKDKPIIIRRNALRLLAPYTVLRPTLAKRLYAKLRQRKFRQTHKQITEWVARPEGVPINTYINSVIKRVIS
jgi:hypothetical protein